MPQIAYKAGIEFYLFNRPHDPSRPPIIWWQGLDGSRVLGYTTPGEYTQPMDHQHTTVLGMKNADRAGVKNILVLYGMGDHGGGPNPDDVAGIAKLNASPDDVRVKTTNVSDYIDLLLTEKKDFPVVDGELQHVFPGCYTTQVEMKRHNRQAEQLLLNAEKMSELAVFFDYRDYYPNRDITEAWKIALLDQAHDLAAGSGIGPIYADAARQYQEVFERGHRALNFSLQNLGLQLDTRGEGVPVVVYNPQSWDRSDLVITEVSAFSLPSRMVAVHGEEDSSGAGAEAGDQSGRPGDRDCRFCRAEGSADGAETLPARAGNQHAQGLRALPCRLARNLGLTSKTNSSEWRSILRPATLPGCTTRRISAKRSAAKAISWWRWRIRLSKPRRLRPSTRGQPGTSG